MPQNPLFPGDNPEPERDQRHLLHARENTIQPLSNEEKAAIGANPAADLIRDKLTKLYATEPNALEEEREAEAAKPRSKHQQFMLGLSTSGKSLADIQTEWHNYYLSLPDNEKHEVWQEFYRDHQAPAAPKPQLGEPAPARAREVVTTQAEHKKEARSFVGGEDTTPADQRTPGAIRSAIRGHVDRQAAKLSHGTKQNLKSLAFGLSTGLVVLLIFLFGFFNEVVIAPFIQPGRSSATPIIVSTSSVDASQPSVIIPKINVQIPVVYNVASNDENVIENALMDGVVHYPTTKLPGQKGNAAFFGHSSNNIFNKGKYKFAFVLLHKLQDGDVFYLTYNGQVYSYKVISTTIVPPSDVGVLNDIPGQTATATLITCDPPGTSINRLVVVGQQISPDPAGNSAVSTPAAPSTSSTSELPGNGPTLWTRLWRSIF